MVATSEDFLKTPDLHESLLDGLILGIGLQHLKDNLQLAILLFFITVNGELTLWSILVICSRRIFSDTFFFSIIDWSACGLFLINLIFLLIWISCLCSISFSLLIMGCRDLLEQSLNLIDQHLLSVNISLSCLTSATRILLLLHLHSKELCQLLGHLYLLILFALLSRL